MLRKSQAVADLIINVPLIKTDGTNATGLTGPPNTITTKIIGPAGTAITGYDEATITEPNSDGVYSVKFPTTATNLAFTLVDQDNPYTLTVDSSTADVKPTTVDVNIVTSFTTLADMENSTILAKEATVAECWENVIRIGFSNCAGLLGIDTASGVTDISVTGAGATDLSGHSISISGNKSNMETSERVDSVLFGNIIFTESNGSYIPSFVPEGGLEAAIGAEWLEFYQTGAFPAGCRLLFSMMGSFGLQSFDGELSTIGDTGYYWSNEGGRLMFSRGQIRTAFEQGTRSSIETSTYLLKSEVDGMNIIATTNTNSTSNDIVVQGRVVDNDGVTLSNGILPSKGLIARLFSNFIACNNATSFSIVSAKYDDGTDYVFDDCTVYSLPTEGDASNIIWGKWTTLSGFVPKTEGQTASASSILELSVDGPAPIASYNLIYRLYWNTDFGEFTCRVGLGSSANSFFPCVDGTTSLYRGGGSAVQKTVDLSTISEDIATILAAVVDKDTVFVRNASGYLTTIQRSDGVNFNVTVGATGLPLSITKAV